MFQITLFTAYPDFEVFVNMKPKTKSKHTKIGLDGQIFYYDHDNTECFANIFGSTFFQ